MIARRARTALLACVTIPAALLVAGPAYADAPANDAITGLQPLALVGDSGSFNYPFADDSGATATDLSADGALSGDEGKAQHTLWYRLDPAAARVTVTVSSATVPNVVAGVVTSPDPDASLDGTTSEFDVIEDANVVNTDSHDAHRTLTVTSGVGDTESFTFTADSRWVADDAHSYYVGIGSIGADSDAPAGPINLSISYVSAPSNDDFAAALPVTTGPVTTGDTTGATPELEGGSVDLDPVVLGPSMFSVWFSYTATASGRASIATTKSSFRTALEVCESAVPSAADCAAHPVVSSASDASAHPTVDFDAVGGTTYYVFLDGQPTGTGPNAAGEYRLKVTLDKAPGNDDVATPTVLARSGTARTTGTNVGAGATVAGTSPPGSVTSEASHGLRFNAGAQHTVWYRYSPTHSGRVVVATSGALDTVVEVFTGSLSKGFHDTGTGNDNDAPGYTFSRFALKVKHGKTYTIGVDGSHAAGYPQGGFDLALGDVPDNDNLSGAAYLAKHKKASAGSGKVHGSTEFATLQKREPKLVKQVGVDTWYTFVAPKAGKYHFTESMPGGSAALGVYSGKGSSTLGLDLVKYRSAPGSKPAKLSIKAKRGERFAVEAASTDGAAGKYTLHWH